MRTRNALRSERCRSSRDTIPIARRLSPLEYSPGSLPTAENLPSRDLYVPRCGPAGCIEEGQQLPGDSLSHKVQVGAADTDDALSSIHYSSETIEESIGHRRANRATPDQIPAELAVIQQFAGRSPPRGCRPLLAIAQIKFLPCRRDCDTRVSQAVARSLPPSHDDRPHRYKHPSPPVTPDRISDTRACLGAVPAPSECRPRPS